MKYPDIEQMERRLRALEDLEEIKKLQRRYMQHHDRLEFELLLDLFTDDAEVEVRSSGVMKGRDEFKKIFVDFLGKRRTERHDGHLVGEPMLTVDGDTAAGYWTVYMLFSVPEIAWVQGRNDCEYRKVDGAWKISKLKFTRTLASSPELYP